MNEQEEFFSPNHKRLLSIAAWAKYLAWVMLVIYILLAVTGILPYRYRPDYNNQFSMGLWEFVKSNPFDGFSILITMASTILKGVVYFLVLKGISLGLNMIVETDINYRERKRAEGPQ